jgi:hypothetical protein
MPLLPPPPKVKDEEKGPGAHRSVIAVGGYDNDDHRGHPPSPAGVVVLSHHSPRHYKGRTFGDHGDDFDVDDVDALSKSKKAKRRRDDYSGELHPGSENAFFVLRLIKWVHDLVADFYEEHPLAVKAFFICIVVLVYHTYLGVGSFRCF